MIDLKVDLIFFGLNHPKSFKDQSKLGGEGALNWRVELAANNKVGAIMKKKEEVAIFISGFYRAIHTIFNMRENVM